MIGREDEVRRYRERVPFFYGVVAVFFALILARLFYLQILSGDELRRFSESNRLKKERLFPTRGVITDRDGRVIVDNRASFDVILLAQYYPFDERTDARLARAMGMSREELEKKIARVRARPTFHPVLLKADVSKDVLAAIETDAEGFPGIDIETTVQRVYPLGDFASQLLGYVGEVNNTDLRQARAARNTKLQMGDYIGKSGLERQFDPELRGVNGVGYVEVDAKGRRKIANPDSTRLLGYVTQTDPVAGQNIQLTIDADLEMAAQQAFRTRGFVGSVVALDPRTGEILALVNEPSYDPTVVSAREIDSKTWAELVNNKVRPLRNRSIQDIYPPGSTFKIFLSLAGLAEGLVNANTKVHCSGGMRFGGRRFHCWKTHGEVDFIRSIKESCDIFFYQLGNQLGVDRIAKYARLFGFGAQTGLTLPGEQKGLIPDTEWKNRTYKQPWHPGETLSVAIGQGFVSVTPLQLVNAFAAVASQGQLFRPFLVRQIDDPLTDTVTRFKPELIRRIELEASEYELVKTGLFEVVNRPGGTAVRSYSPLTEISGKTGTAQVRNFANIMKVRCSESELQFRHHGWFAGYAPKENPEIAVVALAEHSCHGSAAGPVVKEVIEAYFNKKNAPPPEMGPFLPGLAAAEAQGDRAPSESPRGPQVGRHPQSKRAVTIPVKAVPDLGVEEDE